MCFCECHDEPTDDDNFDDDGAPVEPCEGRCCGGLCSDSEYEHLANSSPGTDDESETPPPDYCYDDDDDSTAPTTPRSPYVTTDDSDELASDDEDYSD
jgi:hypothetical protein